MVKKTIPSGLDPFGGIYTANISAADMATMAPTSISIEPLTSIPIEPLTNLDKLEQVKTAVLHHRDPYIYCNDCKYKMNPGYGSDACSLTGKKERDAYHEYMSYTACRDVNGNNDCKKFRRTRKSKFTRAVKWAARWPR